MGPSCIENLLDQTLDNLGRRLIAEDLRHGVLAMFLAELFRGIIYFTPMLPHFAASANNGASRPDHRLIRCSMSLACWASRSINVQSKPASMHASPVVPDPAKQSST